MLSMEPNLPFTSILEYDTWLRSNPGRKLLELKSAGIYSTKQEQGQERTWINLEDYEQFDVLNKDIKDEVFIGHLPREAKAEHVYDLFEHCGIIREIRMMYEFSHQNRGFCFVAFTAESEAKRALEMRGSPQLHLFFHLDRPLKLSDKIHVEMSRKQKTLFLGGIAKDYAEDEIKAEFSRLFDGDKDQWNNAMIEIVHIQKKPNWGFCFIDFKNHREAAIAKRIGPREMFGTKITLDWASSMEKKELQRPELTRRLSEDISSLTPGMSGLTFDTLAMRRTSLPSYLGGIEPYVDLLTSLKQRRDTLRNTRARKMLHIHDLESELISENCELKSIETNIGSLESSIYAIEANKLI